MERRIDEEGRRMLNELEAWLAGRDFEAQKTHLEAFKVRIKQYTFGWESRLKNLKRKLTSAAIGPVVLTDHLKE